MEGNKAQRLGYAVLIHGGPHLRATQTKETSTRAAGMGLAQPGNALHRRDAAQNWSGSNAMELERMRSDRLAVTYTVAQKCLLLPFVGNVGA